MNIAYFKNGELYDVSPRNTPDDLFQDREVAYKADKIISDGMEYDLTRIEDIQAIPIPAFTPSIPAVLELSYIMKIRCGVVDNPTLIPTFVQKTLDLMRASCFIWRERDYMQVIRSYHRVGLIEKGMQYKAEFKRLHGDIDENLLRAAQAAALESGKPLGHDAVEITAHGCCAIDHEPIQGRIFLMGEYEKMQSGRPFQDIDGNQYEPLKRPIGVNGCMHFATSCFSKWHKRIYSDEFLAEMYRLNHTMYEVDGREYARYEIHAFMREIEERTKAEKEIAVDAMDRNDMETRIRCQHCINKLAEQYYKLAEASGLKSRLGNSRVQGFRRVKNI